MGSARARRRGLGCGMRHIDDGQVREKLDWRSVLDALRAALAAKDDYRTPPRVAIDAPQGGTFLTMPCVDPDGWFGVKQVAVLPGNRDLGLPTVQAHYTLFSDSGTASLSCSATVLTRLRTSAVSALAAEVLAPAEARRLLIVGTGSLAPWMAEAHLQTRRYEAIEIWGRSPEKAENVARELEERLAGQQQRPEVQPVTELQEAVRLADVISAATTSRTPLILGDWLRPGQHVDLVGAFVPGMMEVDSGAVRRCDIFVDDRGAAQEEAGDLLHAANEGWSFERIRGDIGELLRGDVVARTSEGRSVPVDATTMFKSVGLALEDLAVARLLID